MTLAAGRCWQVLKSRCDKFNDAYETKLGGQVEATLQSLKTMEHSFRDIKMADHVRGPGSLTTVCAAASTAADVFSSLVAFRTRFWRR